MGLGLAVLALYFGIRHVNDVRETPFTGIPSKDAPNFVDRTVDFNIRVAHRQGDDRLTGLDESLGPGVCAFDFDNDGWVDLFIVNGTGDTRYYGRQQWWQGKGGHRLLRNRGGAGFEDVTEQAHITAVTQGQGCVAADFDNDGHPDILVTGIGSNLLLRNNGDGTFTDVTAGSGLEDSGWHTAAAVADVDGDGLLDVYIGGFIAFKKGAHTFEPGSQYKQDASPLFNSSLYPALPKHLYRNVGGFHFKDMTETAGVADADGRTLAALWIDLNGDRKPDLLVLNAAGTGSTTGFINQGDWHFEPLGIHARIESGLPFRGIAVGDLNRDGHADLILTGGSGNQTTLLVPQPVPAGSGPVLEDQGRQWQLENERYASFSPWSPAVGDFNNDGWPDLFVANGQLGPDSDTPHITEGQAKQLWLNAGGSRFQEVEPTGISPLLDHQSGRGVAIADFNNDGTLDVYVAHNNDLGQLLINEPRGESHWMSVKLVDTRGNRDAVGARVAVTTKQGTQVQWAIKGQGFLSDSDPRMHFGLGAATEATVNVTWADGSQDAYRKVAADEFVRIVRGSRLEASAPARGLPDLQAAALTNEDPETRLDYLRGLAGSIESPEVALALRSALVDPDESVRRGLAESIGRNPTSAGFPLLVRFLEDRSPGVVVTAVDGLCRFQDEDTVRYLLRALNHPSSEVRQHGADCFASYFGGFQEQHAVIHRKYLALPYLASLAFDPAPDVRMAAVRALGASEKYRGVPPLLDVLKEPESQLTAEAVRSLGLIRDRAALPGLLELAAGPNLEPATYAQIFIALKRLDQENLRGMLEDFGAGRAQFAKLSTEKRLATFFQVFDDRDGVVLPRQTIQSLAASTYRASKGNENAAFYFARLSESSGAPAATASVTPLTMSGSSRVRTAAYLALFEINPANRSALITQGLHDTDVNVRLAILKRLAKAGVSVPSWTLSGALADEDTRIAALDALQAIDDPNTADELTSWVFSDDQNDALKVAALRALDRAHRQPTPPENWQSSNDELVIAMLKCEGRRLPAVYVSKTPPGFVARYLRYRSPRVRAAVYDFYLTREELWAKSPVVTLLENGDRSALRRHVFQALPADYFHDGAALLRIAGNRNDPLRFDAMRLLRGHEEAHTVEGLLAIARNGDENHRTRVLAASLLPAHYAKDILPTLASMHPAAGDAGR